MRAAPSRSLLGASSPFSRGVRQQESGESPKHGVGLPGNLRCVGRSLAVKQLLLFVADVTWQARDRRCRFGDRAASRATCPGCRAGQTGAMPEQGGGLGAEQPPWLEAGPVLAWFQAMVLQGCDKRGGVEAGGGFLMLLGSAGVPLIPSRAPR